jgi:hypothetical protein
MILAGTAPASLAVEHYISGVSVVQRKTSVFVLNLEHEEESQLGQSAWSLSGAEDYEATLPLTAAEFKGLP